MVVVVVVVSVCSDALSEDCDGERLLCLTRVSDGGGGGGGGGKS